MIAVDTSALMAILQGEPEAEACQAALAAHEPLLIAAPTLTEALIVAAGRGLAEEMRALLEGLALTTVSLTPERARKAADAYLRWGKRFHRAALNYGDCFAYALAVENACPLLFVGDDFTRTGVAAAIG